MTIYPIVWAVLLTASPIHSALAQRAPASTTAPKPGPANDRKADPTAYRSVFDAYRANNDDAVISWREANDRVGRIGGWRVYARESQASEPARAAPPAQAQPTHQHR